MAKKNFSGWKNGSFAYFLQCNFCCTKFYDISEMFASVRNKCETTRNLFSIFNKLQSSKITGFRKFRCFMQSIL